MQGGFLRVFAALSLASLTVLGQPSWAQSPPVVLVPPKVLAPSVPLGGGSHITLPLAEGQRVPFQLSWGLVPQDVDDTILQLHEGQPITSARLVPIQMWQLDSDLKAQDGSMVVPAGTQFVRAVSVVVLGCSVRSLKVGTVEGFLFANERYVCVTDENQDGTVDHYFFRGETNSGMVVGEETIPRTVFSASGGRLRIADPFTVEGGPTLELQYSNYAFISKWILFQPCIRPPGKSCQLLTETVGLRKREVPGEFDVLGGRFEIIEKNDAGVRIRMTKPFTPTIITINR